MVTYFTRRISWASNRRCSDFYRVLLLAVSADQYRAPAHIDAASHCETALDRVTEWSPVSIVHQRKKLADTVASSVIPIGANYRFGRCIHIIDPAVVIRRNDAFGDRLQRVLGLALAAAQ